MSKPDIRVGDLVKATLLTDSDISITGRITEASSGYVSTKRHYLSRSEWLFEVLDRPLPPVEEELLANAVDSYRVAQGYSSETIPQDVHAYGPGVKAVINFIREYDRNNNKENTK